MLQQHEQSKTRLRDGSGPLVGQTAKRRPKSAKAGNVEGLEVAGLFAGIGGFELGLARRLGGHAMADS